MRTQTPPTASSRLNLLFELAVLAALAAFALYHLQLPLLLRDTTTVGGDTPAHNYMASQLGRQLFNRGRLVDWAPGWWAGFPLFQYYFPLPYLLIALLSTLIPFNIAFKLVSVLGILALPTTTYAALRMLRFPRPTPILGALAAQAFLFSQIHVMWGANILSTLAGMIANSISFALLPLVLACWVHDAREGHARLRSSLLALLLVMSHFFTSAIAAITIITLPLLMPRGRRLAACRALLAGGLLTTALCAWWLLPLFVKGPYSVDFGTNWHVDLLRTIPREGLWLAPFAIIGLGIGLLRRSPAILLFGVMALLAALLFLFGYDHVSAVFVNVRMWPFLHYAFLLLAVIGAGACVQRLRATPLLVTSLLVLLLLHLQQHAQSPIAGRGPIRNWARFNYEGLEAKPKYPVIRDLLLPLKGTPGRLAHDLTEEANALGSTRIFELTPHLIGKPIIEGGLVSSGLSSYFTYYIQCEISQACAGYPTLVTPTAYDFATGVRHLQLFNVKHIIAHGETLRRDLRRSADWRPLKRSGNWESFELTTHDGHYVTVPKNQPRVVHSRAWERYALEWFYRPEFLDQPFIFQDPTRAPAPPMAGAPMAEEEFRQLLMQADNTGDINEWLHLGPFPLPPGTSDPLAYAPIDEAHLDPQAGDQVNRDTWTLLFANSPQTPWRHYRRFPIDTLAYSFVNIFSPTAREALLHYGNDDGARLYLNDHLVVDTGIVTFGELRRTPVHLKAGRNRLLHKLEQKTGGNYFHVRLTDPTGQPFHDVIVSATPHPPLPLPLVPEPVVAPLNPIVEEEVTAHSIRFITRAVGQPHLIAVSYFPNWKVRGADAIHLATPSFMLVYPNQPEVELTFGRTRIDVIGIAITLVGWLLILLRLLLRASAARLHRHPTPGAPP